MKKENHIKSILHMPSLTQSGEEVPTLTEKLGELGSLNLVARVLRKMKVVEEKQREEASTNICFVLF